MTVPEIKKEAFYTFANSKSDCMSICFIYSAMMIIIILFEKMLLDVNHFLGAVFFWIILAVITYLNLGLKSFFLNLASDRSANNYNLIEPKIRFKYYLFTKAEIALVNVLIVLFLAFVLKGKIGGELFLREGAFYTINTELINIWTIITFLPAIFINLYLSQIPYLFLERYNAEPMAIAEQSFKMMFTKIIWFLIIIIDYFIWFGVYYLLLRLVPAGSLLELIVEYGMLFVFAFFTMPYVQICLGYFYRELEKNSGWHEDDRRSRSYNRDKEIYEIGLTAQKNRKR